MAVVRPNIGFALHTDGRNRRGHNDRGHVYGRYNGLSRLLTSNCLITSTASTAQLTTGPEAIVLTPPANTVAFSGPGSTGIAGSVTAATATSLTYTFTAAPPSTLGTLEPRSSRFRTPAPPAALLKLRPSFSARRPCTGLNLYSQISSSYLPLTAALRHHGRLWSRSTGAKWQHPVQRFPVRGVPEGNAGVTVNFVSPISSATGGHGDPNLGLDDDDPLCHGSFDHHRARRFAILPSRSTALRRHRRAAWRSSVFVAGGDRGRQCQESASPPTPANSAPTTGTVPVNIYGYGFYGGNRRRILSVKS